MANTAPTDIILSENTFNELSESLLVGTLSTTDTDQTDGVAHSYAIAETMGTDFEDFEINQAGQLSFI